MKEKLKLLIKRLKNPKPWAVALWLVLSIAVICVTVISLVIEFLPEAVEYILYGFSAICLTYSVYTVIIGVPKIKGKIIKILQGYEFTSNMLADYGFRTTVFAVISFVINLAYAIMQAVIAFASRSVWYGALAGYYIILTVSKGILLNSKRRVRKLSKQKNSYQIRIIKIFKNTGVSLIVITLGLSVAIFYMATDNGTFSYPGLTVYASAAYAFYKIIMAIYNFIKAKRFDDLTVWSIRNINLADALVSILALQTALLASFAKGVKVGGYNLLTGIAVSVIIIGVGVFMIIKSNLMLKRYKNNE